ncbi:MAG: NADH-quinone oxidoreductase subunit C [Acidobacteria bacterium]|nr:NADH-quinone oxidoreductase subunit C [Acidobacteriota bacterium]
MIPPEVARIPDTAALLEFDPGAIAEGKYDRRELTLMISPERLFPACEFLKTKRGYRYLSDVTAVDRYPSEPRFEVVYQLYCHDRKERLRLKCLLNGERAVIASVVPIWGAANWYEREVYDLFGVQFQGHPHLRRILMPEDWEGHPLRKDYPVTGYR